VTRPFNVLFLCTGNSARSILSEAILNREGDGRFAAYSAGSFPKGEVHPAALALLCELGYATEGYRSRIGPGQWTGEFVATFGLVLTILGTVRHRPRAVAASVGLYISAAYWFTSSTNFANPAITLVRSLSDTFAGIAPQDVPMFIIAQMAGAIAATVVAGVLFCGPFGMSATPSSTPEADWRQPARSRSDCLSAERWPTALRSLRCFQADRPVSARLSGALERCRLSGRSNG
jgi:protein-tyrosine-phosphatase